MDACETGEETETASKVLYAEGEILMTVTYMLEMSEEELVTLWAMLNFLDAMAGGQSDPTEKEVLEKVQRLMEGR